jgi:hypothetical protein
MENIEKLTTEEIIKLKEYEGVVKGVPTGMYSDRESYGNAPILVFILDQKLPCRFRANPYSHRHAIKEGVDEIKNPFESLSKVLLSFKPDNENETLGIASAFIDQSIRNKSSVEVHGNYKEGIFYSQFLKIGDWGFEFPGYKMPFERRRD